MRALADGSRSRANQTENVRVCRISINFIVTYKLHLGKSDAYSAASLYGSGLSHLSFGERAARVSSRRRRGAKIGA